MADAPEPPYALVTDVTREVITAWDTRTDLSTPLDDPRVAALVEAANGVVNEYYNQVHGPVIYNIKNLDAALEAIASPSISAPEEINE